jgi:hypothetical protein
MGERQAGDEGQGERRKERSLDLSVPQVAGSAVAAVVAAKLAANLGVYGTILGAGVVSVLGTCGGSIFQHVFRRTGRHMQEVAVQAKPRGRRAPRGAGPDPTLLPGAAGTVVTDGSTTRLLAEPGLPGPELPDAHDIQDAPGAHGAPEPALPGDGYSEATLHRARARGVKRPLVAVALAFGLTMGGITVYEAAAGENLSGNGTGTTVGDVFSGRGSSSGSGHTPSPAPSTTRPGDNGGGAGAGPTSGATGTAPRHGGQSSPTPTAPSTPGSGGATGGGSGSSGGGEPAQSPSPTSTPTPWTTPTPSAPTGGTGLTGGAGASLQGGSGSSGN